MPNSKAGTESDPNTEVSSLLPSTPGALGNSGLNLQCFGVSSFFIPCPHPDTTGPQRLKSYPLLTGVRVDGWTAGPCGLPSGRGKELCSPQSSAHCEIHISWRCPQGLSPSVLAGEKDSELERPACGAGGDRKDPLQRLAQLALGTAALGAPGFPQLSNHPFCSRAANDAIKFIRRTSVLNDRTTGCPLREARLKQLKDQEPEAGLKTIPAGLSAISLLASEDRGVLMTLSLSHGTLTTQPLKHSCQLWRQGYPPEQVPRGLLVCCFRSFLCIWPVDKRSHPDVVLGYSQGSEVKSYGTETGEMYEE